MINPRKIRSLFAIRSLSQKSGIYLARQMQFYLTDVNQTPAVREFDALLLSPGPAPFIPLSRCPDRCSGFRKVELCPSVIIIHTHLLIYYI